MVLRYWAPNLKYRKDEALLHPLATNYDKMFSKDVLTSDLEKATYFNEFFINISEEITKNLDPLDPNTLPSSA